MIIAMGTDHDLIIRRHHIGDDVAKMGHHHAQMLRERITVDQILRLGPLHERLEDRPQETHTKQIIAANGNQEHIRAFLTDGDHIVLTPQHFFDRVGAAAEGQNGVVAPQMVNDVTPAQGVLEPAVAFRNDPQAAPAGSDFIPILNIADGLENGIGKGKAALGRILAHHLDLAVMEADMRREGPQGRGHVIDTEIGVQDFLELHRVLICRRIAHDVDQFLVHNHYSGLLTAASPIHCPGGLPPIRQDIFRPNITGRALVRLGFTARSDTHVSPGRLFSRTAQGMPDVSRPPLTAARHRQLICLRVTRVGLGGT